MDLLTSTGGTVLLSCAGTALLPGILPYVSDDIIRFANVISMSTSFGTHFWVGSVAGLTMFHNLKRRVFGKLQSKLFPKYATLNTSCSLIALATYLHLHNISPTDSLSMICEKSEGTMLLFGLFGNIANSLYFIPATTKLMFMIHAREIELGLEDTVGGTTQLKKSNKASEDDKNLVKKFQISHGISMLMSLVSMGACGAYIYFISKNLKF